jgi:hypothetical protein
MKTEDLIRALAADGTQPVSPIARTLLNALLGGTALSLGLFAVMLHPRDDLMQALHTPAFIFKLLVAAALTATAATLLSQTARPLPPLRSYSILMLAPALLAAGVVIDLWVMPAHTWFSRLIGHNALHCLAAIPLLSLPMMACLLVALMRGAPKQAAVAGAVAGLVSGGLGAALYALTCPDDSPLFVGTWYSIAVVLVTGASTYIGTRALRW